MENSFEKDQFVERKVDEKNFIVLKKKKEAQEKTTVRNNGPEFSDSISDNPRSNSFVSIDFLNLFLFSKEFVIEWLTKLSLKPTPYSIISSTTIYFLAICSTIQRREGGRWLTFLLNAKLPGYNVLHQEVSWETFENFTSKHLKYNSYIDSLPTCLPALLAKQSRHTKQSKQQTSRPTSFRKLESDGWALREGRVNYRKSLENDSQPFVRLSTQPSSIPLCYRVATVWPIRFVGLAFSPMKCMDLYKEKAFVFFKTPLEKRVKKDFVGFYAKKPTLGDREKGLTKRDFFKVLDKDNIVLPWFRIDSYNRHSRTILPEWKEKFSLKYTADRVTEYPYIAARGTRSNIQKNVFCNTSYTPNSREKIHKNHIRDKILGLQYLLPFYKSKESVFAESDSIPLKLESPYSIQIKSIKIDLRSALSSYQQSVCLKRSHFAKNKDLSVALAKIAPLPQLRCNKAASALLQNINDEAPLKEKKKRLSGKYVTPFQEKLQNFFYSYGFLPLNRVPASLSNSKSDQISVIAEPACFDASLALPCVPYEAKQASRQAGLLVGKQKITDDSLEADDQPISYLKEFSASQQPLTSEVEMLAPYAGPNPGTNDQAIFNGSLISEAGSSSNQIAKLGDSDVESLINEVSLQLTDLYAEHTWNLTKTAKKHQQTNGVFHWFYFHFAKWNLFEKNNVMCRRLMSGYKMPEHTKQEATTLFRKFVLPHLLISYRINFSYFYLINQVVLRPFYIKLPPLLPFSFFTNLASSLSNPISSAALLHKPTVPCLLCFACKASKQSKANRAGRHTGSLVAADNKIANSWNYAPTSERHSEKAALSDWRQLALPPSHINVTYKQLSLQELKEVKDVFFRLGRDYESYLNRPKDSAPAIRISSSLEDDKILELEAERKEKKDDEKPTRFEQLQTLRGRERKFELGKSLRSFAYKDQLAIDESKAFDKHEENSWILFRLGSKNLLSDRKYSFFGRKDLLIKRLIAKEQKEMNQQIRKSNSSASLPARQPDCLPALLCFACKASKQSKQNKHTSGQAVLGALHPKGQAPLRSRSYKKLQRRARKGLMRLLGPLDLSAHHTIGSQDRTHKPNLALRGKVLKSAYSHLRWQKKRFYSRLLGTPSKRHLVMPEIKLNDWKKILEWQLQNYFFLEEERLKPLIKEDPEKTFKIRQLHMYLPWVTIRTPLKNPFQWPLTRLDDSYSIKTHITDKNLSLRPACFARQIADRTNNSKLPAYIPVSYWDSGKAMSLSTCVSYLSERNSDKATNKKTQNTIFKQLSHLVASCTSQKAGLAKQNRQKTNATTLAAKPFLQTRILNEPYLCEPLTNQSWLLIYRLFLIFGLKNLLKYIYRISLKDFIIQMANSDFGLMVTSTEMREWLEHAPQKSFYTPRKRLQEVAAIEDTIPTLSEIVWYVRNSGRGRTGAHGLLIVGPAGAEKTSVVQAIAGECEVPVIAQSMSALAFTFDDPYEQLEDVFRLARQQAPCVLFLDDLDVVGQSRAHVITNDIGTEDLLFSLDTYTAEGKLCFANLSNSLHIDSSQNRPGRNILSQTTHSKGETASFLHSSCSFNPLVENPVNQPNLEFLSEHEADTNKIGSTHKHQNLALFQQNQEFQTRKLNLLLRLLTEMDGISPLNGVVVVATSERPALLDPALVRAGRLERRIYLSLPNKERRIQILKRETKKLGHIASMPWDYLGLRTTNMSGANIFSAINHSAIRAILDNTVHTIETLDHGLNCVIGLPNKKISSASLPALPCFVCSAHKGASPLVCLACSALLAKQASKAEQSKQSRQAGRLVCRDSNFMQTTFKRSSVNKMSLHINDPFHRSRLAFYQAGKAVLHNLLFDHPQLGFLSLDELVNNLSERSLCASQEASTTVVADSSFQTIFRTPEAGKPMFRKTSARALRALPAKQSRHTKAQAPLPCVLCEGGTQKRKPPYEAGRQATFAELCSDSMANFKDLAKHKSAKQVVEAHDLLSQRPDSLMTVTNYNGSNLALKHPLVSARTKRQFETRLIGLYAGKAAELLHLNSNNGVCPLVRGAHKFCCGSVNWRLASSNETQSVTEVFNSFATSQQQPNKKRQHTLPDRSLLRYQPCDARLVAKQAAAKNYVPRKLWQQLQLSSMFCEAKHSFDKKVNKLNSKNYVLFRKTSDESKDVESNWSDSSFSRFYKSRTLLTLKKNSISTVSQARGQQSLLGNAEKHAGQPSEAGWPLRTGRLWESDLGSAELLTASSLISLMIDRWYLYSQKIFTYKINKLIPSLNHEQIKDETLFPLAKRFSKELEFDLLKPAFWGRTGDANQKTPKNQDSSISQKRNKTHWWEAKVCQALEMGERPYGKWYRIYLPKVEERELNEEWVPPDSIIHQASTLSNINGHKNQSNIKIKNNIAKEKFSAVSSETFETDSKNPNVVSRRHWNFVTTKGGALLPEPFLREAGGNPCSEKTLNDLYLFERDSSYQNAVTNCFYKAFHLLDENRELLDLFADHFIRFQIVRSHEIAKICSFFFSIYE